METQIAGLNALVTGASGGIGWAVAETLASEGAQLALHAGRNLADLELKVSKSEWHPRAYAVQADVTKSEEVDAMFAATNATLGRVDLCIINAGIWPHASLALHTMPVARIREVIEVNLLGAIWTARAFMAQLARLGPRSDGRGAAICLIGSTAGRFGEAGHAEYAISKAGLYGLLRTLKNEIVHCDPYARVNLVEPGWTATPMATQALANDSAITQALSGTPLQQMARPQDIARTVAFLCSPALARHITGEVLTVAGGMEGRRLWTPDEIRPEHVRARLLPDPS